MFCEKCGIKLVETAATKAGNLKPICANCNLGGGGSTVAASRAKSRVGYVLFGIFFGVFGIHNFYAGYKEIALTQLLLTILLCWIPVVGDIVIAGVWIWAVVQVATVVKDANGNPMS
jgi:TM2 domain-containing membrane protein YozV